MFLRISVILSVYVFLVIFFIAFDNQSDVHADPNKKCCKPAHTLAGDDEFSFPPGSGTSCICEDNTLIEDMCGNNMGGACTGVIWQNYVAGECINGSDTANCNFDGTVNTVLSVQKFNLVCGVSRDAILEPEDNFWNVITSCDPNAPNNCMCFADTITTLVPPNTGEFENFTALNCTGSVCP